VTLSELVDVLASLASEPAEPARRSDRSDRLSALDHGLQCAFELSTVRPDDVELQLAGLVHDIGHRFGSDDDHGRLGAACVRALLGDRVAGLVEAHVPAKRYLVTTDASYRSRLSADSVRTLALQGGPLGPEDAAAFAASPVGAAAVVLRRADDAAKVLGRVVPPLAYWLPLLRESAH